MPHIPEEQRTHQYSELLANELAAPHEGKVRETYDLPGHPDKLAVYHTDRISIRDIILNAKVPGKGEALVTATVHGFKTPPSGIPNHLIAFGSGIDSFLPERLRGIPDLQKRMLIVYKMVMFQGEFIARGNLTGSGWGSYKENGTVCGIRMPEGLHDGAELPALYFTPSTKEKEGHDQNISEAQLVDIVGGEEVLTRLKGMTLSRFGAQREYLFRKGIILADTKYEFGVDSNKIIRIGDEVDTPDSARMWLYTDWLEARKQKRAPDGYDKEPVRQAGNEALLPDGTVINFNKLNPKSEKDRGIAWSWQVPDQVINDTARRYRRIIEIRTGGTIERFWMHDMGIRS